MPIPDKAKSTEYMREYMRKRRARQRLMEHIQAQFRETMLTWRQMFEIIRETSFILSRSDLTDREKVARISDITISKELMPYFKEAIAREIRT